MPEMTFTVRWPDASVQHCYSPSLVVHDHLDVGAEYPVSEFLARAATALTTASERVRARYGMTCTSALAQLDDLTARAATFAPDAPVRVLGLEPPLPPPT
ncbi:MSMEG_0570 family nitrogen starvation response protein [Kineococcus rubinsiae]|uniref:MSMEG_0570 family nitrogen starvation response protein n=1 Tax=Kineococcus rubinsiae TaxID=2609562 RepID=UPI00142FD45D|nr:MSMEG_0570 family nitrogen starvation response protein [Kineococcus rubinsiae]